MFDVTRRGLVAASTLLLAGLGVSGASLAAVPDYDGDGFVGTADCQPFDPAVHPGAVDRPDLSFEDSNCDGIDGDVSRSIFVALIGDDSATGTQLNPVRTIQQGIDLAAAATPPKDVLIAGGTYNQSIVLKPGVSLYGGYTPITWSRSLNEPVTIQGSPQAATADNVRGVELQLVNLQGSRGSGASAYGLRAVNNASVALVAAGVTAGPGGPGSSASQPSRPGKAGDGGGGGGGGNCGFSGGPGGGGGNGAWNGVANNNGGPGGNGGHGGAPNGDGGTKGTGNGGGSAGGGNGGTGGGGANGLAGNAGANATSRTDLAAAVWNGASGNAGTNGTAGSGGGAGGGAYGVSLTGGVGGGGGGGGSPGAGGGPGSSGGGSFALYLYDSSVVASDGTTLISDAGGAGGNGAPGAPGGQGGNPGSGGPGGYCLGAGPGTAGASGGPGGNGGAGGSGGGGAGGPSAGVFMGGTTSTYVLRAGSTATAGAGGSGGQLGGTGTPAANGQAGPVVPVSAPSSQSDFDGDGVPDISDNCPTVPGPATNGGCPVRPVVTPATCADAGVSTPAGGGSVAISLACADPAHLPLVSYTIISGPSHGALSAIDQSSGQVTYTSNGGYSGTDTLTYLANNAGGASNTASVTITVPPSPPGGGITIGTTGITIGTTGTTTGGGGSAVPLSASVAAASMSGPTASLTIVCQGSPGQRCAGDATLTVRERRRGQTILAVSAGGRPKPKTVIVTLAVGRGSFAVPAGQTSRLQITLNATGKRLLADLYKLPATLRLTGTTTLSRSVKFALARVGVGLSDEWRWHCSPCYTTVGQLRITGVPAGARVTVRCQGRGCPFSRRALNYKRNLQLAGLFAGSRLSPGSSVAVDITAGYSIGEVLLYRMQADEVPIKTNLCLPPGYRRPVACR